MKKALALMLAVLMLAGCLAGCGSKPAEQAAAPAAEAKTETKTEVQPKVDTENKQPEVTKETKYADTVIWGRPGDLDTPDPYGGTSAQCEEFTNSTFDTLIYNNPETGEMDPELATSWEANADNSEWTFHLVEGVKFHNGDKFTAEDVKFTYLYAANLDGATNVIKPFTAGSYAEEVEVIDDYTIKFILKQPMADFPAYMEMKVYSKNAVETLGEEGKYIGTGPYYYDAAMTTKGQQFTMSKNHDYWRDQDLYKTEHIICKQYGDANAVVAALQAGEIDYTLAAGIANYNLINDDPKLEAVLKTGCASYYLGFNYGTKTCDMFDVELRKAICQCIDKEAIVAVALEGVGGVASYNFCAPSGLGYAEVNGLEYDPAAGAAVLKEKGVTKLHLSHYQTCAKHAEVIQSCLKQAGVEVELQQVDGTNWTTYKAAQDGYDLFLDYASYRGALLYNFNRFLYRGGSSNVIGWESEEYEKLQDNVTAQTTWEDMVKEFGVLQQWVADNVPVFPIVYANMFLAKQPSVGGGYLGGSENACDWATVYKVVE